jgi:hypothetical protein
MVIRKTTKASQVAQKSPALTNTGLTRLVLARAG